MNKLHKRTILLEIVIPWLWHTDFCIRWIWRWKPEIKASEHFWNVEWLMIDIGGRYE